MLIGLKEALDYAERNRCALAAVNTPFFESLLAVIDVGEKMNIPIVLQCAQVHESLVSIEKIGPAMVELAKRSSAPFVVHIDHGADIDYIRTGLDIGFNSCMIDASAHDYQTNIAMTSEVVEMAHRRGVDVEAELGVMTGNENGDPSQGVADESLYTDVEMAARFVKETHVDCLAASFGTVHGLYRREPKLNYQLIFDLREATQVPIVMHGGSGLSDDQYRRCIAHGVRKINYYTYAAKAAYEAVLPLVDDPSVILFPNLARAAQEAVYSDVSSFVTTVSTCGEEE